MANDDRLISSSMLAEDEANEFSLRPKYLKEYIGQKAVKEHVEIYIEAAKRRGEPLDHALFYGPPGLGKTTLASIIANEMGGTLHITSGPAISHKGELAGILDIPIEREGAIEIASRSRGTPRIVNRLLRRVRDYAQVRGEGKIDLATARAGLDMLSIDELGLDTVDRRILDTMIVKFGGRAVGLDTIAAATGDDASTIEDVYEPYLLQLGFIARTPRGRIPMPAAYLHMGYDLPKDATDPRQERMNF